LKGESLIEQRILSYLAGHERAHDTVRGITEWWILKQLIAEKTKEVEEALASLVAKGKLSAGTGPDGQVTYRLRREGWHKP